MSRSYFRALRTDRHGGARSQVMDRLARAATAAVIFTTALLGCGRDGPGRVIEPEVEEFALSDAPSGLELSVTEGRIDAAWQDNSTDETGFEVHRSQADSMPQAAEYRLLASTASGVTFHSDVEVDPTGRTDYCYKVRAVRTSAGTATYSQFSASACAAPQPQTGSIRVSTTTTGIDLDTEGYTVRIDLGARQPIDVNGTLDIEDLIVGTYAVHLDGVAPNCVVTTENPQTVEVESETIVDVTFEVLCDEDFRIVVTAATEGPDPDPDGYPVQLFRGNRAGSATVPANGTVTFGGLSPGEYELVFSHAPQYGTHGIEYGGVAVNCERTTPRSVVVEVSEPGSVDVRLDVVCGDVSQLAFASPTDGQYDVFIVSSNGTGAAPLTLDPAQDTDPAWSPDGTKLAFASTRGGNRDIYVMNADGTSVAALTDHAAADGEPAWSPDGAKIAFVSHRDDNAEVYVMNADGSKPARLTDHSGSDLEPAWSPDGTQIAFRRTSGGDDRGNIHLMSAVDGSGVTSLPTAYSGAAHPAWSPDGTRIAFTAEVACYYSYGFCTTSIGVMNADGSDVRILPSDYFSTEPTWSPDGLWIAFASCDYYCDPQGIVAVTLDGSRIEWVANAPPGSGYVESPEWRP